MQIQHRNYFSDKLKINIKKSKNEEQFAYI